MFHSDLQSDARRHRRARRRPSGSQDHRDQRAERGGHGTREDRPGPLQLRGRGGTDAHKYTNTHMLTH